MGRFSSVQAYADSNSAIRKVPYEQAAAAADRPPNAVTTSAHAVVKPEKVVNPYGSTAGAGSGEFHVYRHGRNREMQRLARMEHISRVQAANEKFQEELRTNEQWSEARTEKRRRKREKQKESKRRKLNLKKSGIDVVDDVVASNINASEGGGTMNATSHEEEFSYTPGAAVDPLEDKDETVDDATQPEGTKTMNGSGGETKPKISIPNNGSFLEMMMSKQLQEGATKVGDLKQAPVHPTDSS